MGCCTRAFVRVADMVAGVFAIAFSAYRPKKSVGSMGNVAFSAGRLSWSDVMYLSSSGGSDLQPNVDSAPEASRPSTRTVRALVPESLPFALLPTFRDT